MELSNLKTKVLIKKYVRNGYVTAFFLTILISICHCRAAVNANQDHKAQIEYLKETCVNESSIILKHHFQTSSKYAASKPDEFIDEFRYHCCRKAKKIHSENILIKFCLYFFSIFSLDIFLLIFLEFRYDLLIKTHESLLTKPNHLKWLRQFIANMTTGIYISLIINLAVICLFIDIISTNLPRISC